jgi:hypothetical protein
VFLFWLVFFFRAQADQKTSFHWSQIFPLQESRAASRSVFSVDQYFSSFFLSGSLYFFQKKGGFEQISGGIKKHNAVFSVQWSAFFSLQWKLQFIFWLYQKKGLFFEPFCYFGSGQQCGAFLGMKSRQLRVFSFFDWGSLAFWGAGVRWKKDELALEFIAQKAVFSDSWGALMRFSYFIEQKPFVSLVQKLFVKALVLDVSSDFCLAKIDQGQDDGLSLEDKLAVFSDQGVNIADAVVYSVKPHYAVVSLSEKNALSCPDVQVGYELRKRRE